MEKSDFFKDIINTEKTPIIYTDDREEGCIEEYNDDVCPGCANCDFNMVSHPGGDSTRSTEKHYCTLGFWEEDF